MTDHLLMDWAMSKAAENELLLAGCIFVAFGAGLGLIWGFVTMPPKDKDEE